MVFLNIPAMSLWKEPAVSSVISVNADALKSESRILAVPAVLTLDSLAIVDVNIAVGSGPVGVASASVGTNGVIASAVNAHPADLTLIDVRAVGATISLVAWRTVAVPYGIMNSTGRVCGAGNCVVINGAVGASGDRSAVPIDPTAVGGIVIPIVVVASAVLDLDTIPTTEDIAVVACTTLVAREVAGLRRGLQCM